MLSYANVLFSFMIMYASVFALLHEYKSKMTTAFSRVNGRYCGQQHAFTKEFSIIERNILIHHDDKNSFFPVEY